MYTNSIPVEAVSVYNNAQLFTEKGDLAAALAEYKRATEMHPQFIEAFNNIGQIHAQMGNKDLAIDAYTRALNINKDPKVLLNVGVEYFNSGELNAALQYFLESVNLSDDLLEAHFYAGLTHYELKNFHNAKPHLINVTYMNVNHYRANFILAGLHYDSKEYKEAIECIDRIALIHHDKVFIEKFYGFCHYYLGNYGKAIDCLTTALTSHSKYSEFKEYLEKLTYENKIKEFDDIDKTVKELEKSMKKGKKDLPSVSRLSMLYIFKGENKKAEKLLLDYKKKLAS
jgi:tetratricopeptide (TPR) repeat protein